MLRCSDYREGQASVQRAGRSSTVSRNWTVAQIAIAERMGVVSGEAGGRISLSRRWRLTPPPPPARRYFAGAARQFKPATNNPRGELAANNKL
jgi:hypothetical protein